jgi:hypothetical protein
VPFVRRFSRLAGLLEALGGVGPVHHVPPGLDVIRLDVAVLQVEGVFPHVEQDDGGLACGEVGLLVVELVDQQAATQLVPAEDGPAGALDGGGGGGEVGLEGVEGAEVLVDRGGEVAGGLVAAVGGEVLPEGGVVDVAAEVEGEGLLQADDGAVVASVAGLGPGTRARQRSLRKKVRSSSTRTSGCSSAAKWPPTGGSFQCRRSV